LGSLIGKILALLVLAGIVFGAWHYHTRVAPGNVVIGFLNSAKKQDYTAMRGCVTKASAEMLPKGKDDETDATRIVLPKDCTFTITNMQADFSSGTVKAKLTYKVEGAEGNVEADYAVVREGLSWKVDLKLEKATEEGAEAE